MYQLFINNVRRKRWVAADSRAVRDAATTGELAITVCQEEAEAKILCQEQARSQEIRKDQEAETQGTETAYWRADYFLDDAIELRAAKAVLAETHTADLSHS